MTDPTPTAYDEHIAAAQAALGRRNNGRELAADIIAMAQVRATLALAEQARLSNLLAAQASNRELIDVPGLVAEVRELRDLVAAIRATGGLPIDEWWQAIRQLITDRDAQVAVDLVAATTGPGSEPCS